MFLNNEKKIQEQKNTMIMINNVQNTNFIKRKYNITRDILLLSTVFPFLSQLLNYIIIIKINYY